MQEQLAKLAYTGQWKSVLALLRKKPDLVNAASAEKGYTPLHQAAWHGAALRVIQALLVLGANRFLVTKEGKTACDIARLRHPHREDLHYILLPTTRNLAQLLRKLIADTPDLFGAYDGNRLICDRLIACLGENWDGADGSTAHAATGDLPQELYARLDAAVHAITGLPMSSQSSVGFTPDSGFHFTATADFVHRELLPRLRDLAARAAVIPLEQQWTVLSDLFDPVPEWGLRGDLFLWMEMRQSLCQCELSGPLDELPKCTIEDRLVSAFATLTGVQLGGRDHVRVYRYERGGMSSGMVSNEQWRRTIIPLLAQRAEWLQQSWAGLG
jgi:hypothetical protein